MNKLVKIYSKNKHLVNCEKCDGESQEVSEWYQELDDSGKKLKDYTLLNCCVTKDDVQDWAEFEEMNTIIGKKYVKQYGWISIKKGYSPNN